MIPATGARPVARSRRCPAPTAAARRPAGRAARRPGPTVVGPLGDRWPPAAAAMPTMPATLWVPLRRSRSCPPPWSSGHGRPCRRGRTRAPDPLRAAELVGADRDQIGRRAARRRRRARAPPARRRCGRRLAAPGRGPIAATSSSGWTVPISLLTVITDTRPTSGVARPRPARRDRRSRPCPARTSRSSAPVRRASARQDASTAWCSMAEHTRTPGCRRPVGADLPAADDRQVVGLGPAGGEHHLAEVGAEELGDLLAGVVDRSPGPARLGVAARRVAELGSARYGSMASTASGRIGVVAAWSR